MRQSLANLRAAIAVAKNTGGKAIVDSGDLQALVDAFEREHPELGGHMAQFEQLRRNCQTISDRRSAELSDGFAEGFRD